ncbi:MAG: hypothetical protein V4801_32545 [Burkholderia gladioli]
MAVAKHKSRRKFEEASFQVRLQATPEWEGTEPFLPWKARVDHYLNRLDFKIDEMVNIQVNHVTRTVTIFPEYVDSRDRPQGAPVSF